MIEHVSPRYIKDSSDETIIAFYAPLKSVYHATPSGDRTIARLFVKAWQSAGYTVEIASSLRSFDKQGNPDRQRRMVRLAEREAQRIMKRWRKQQIRPSAWFSYHLYYKAPDLIGPIICQALKIPYLVAEASWADKRARGAWSLYHAKVAEALQQANQIICINPVDKTALEKYFQKNKRSTPVTTLKPYLDDNLNNTLSQTTRSQIAKRFSLNTRLPWLVCIAMMRDGDKQASYDILQKVTHRLTQPYQLLIIGDGDNKQHVMTLFANNTNVHFAGALNNAAIMTLLPHFQLLVWPAINEALGMIFLEAQQSGVPVIAGDQGGVSSVVKHEYSGLVLPVTEPHLLVQDMSYAINQLLVERSELQYLQRNTKKYIADNHSLSGAAAQLKKIMTQCIHHARQTPC